jgi:hypothetical protein
MYLPLQSVLKRKAALFAGMTDGFIGGCMGWRRRDRSPEGEGRRGWQEEVREIL